MECLVALVECLTQDNLRERIKPPTCQFYVLGKYLAKYIWMVPAEKCPARKDNRATANRGSIQACQELLLDWNLLLPRAGHVSGIAVYGYKWRSYHRWQWRRSSWRPVFARVKQVETNPWSRKLPTMTIIIIVVYRHASNDSLRSFEEKMVRDPFHLSDDDRVHAHVFGSVDENPAQNMTFCTRVQRKCMPFRFDLVTVRREQSFPKE